MPVYLLVQMDDLAPSDRTIVQSLPLGASGESERLTVLGLVGLDVGPMSLVEYHLLPKQAKTARANEATYLAPHA